MTDPFDAVVNTSPLIFLGKLGCLDLLPARVATTPTVIEEVRSADPEEHPEVDLIDAAVDVGQVDVVDGDLTALPIEFSGLHEGESSVLAVAVDRSLDRIIVDDRTAIRAAKTLGLEPSSTPFLLLEACREGEMTASTFERRLDRLIDLGYHLSPRLYERIRDAARKVPD